ncbi:MAG: thioredoxin family protein [Alphaproteobacteria bacterium]
MAAQSSVCDFGRPAVDFRLRGVDGRDWSLADVRGPKATLVMFICNHCPYVKATIDRVVAVCDELRDDGVGAAAINANDASAYPADSFENMQAFAAAHRMGFPYLWDESQAVARAYDAACTPDFFGFNAQMKLQYRGRLDSGRLERPPAGAPRELFDAMRQIAATGQGPREQVPSMGCSIKWKAH